MRISLSYSHVGMVQDWEFFFFIFVRVELIEYLKE